MKRATTVLQTEGRLHVKERAVAPFRYVEGPLTLQSKAREECMGVLVVFIFCRPIMTRSHHLSIEITY
jgi:hypothetical protein